MKVWDVVRSILRMHFWAALKFGLVGTITAVLYFLVMWLASSKAGFGYIFAVSSAYCISTLFHYLANRHFTFSAQSGAQKSQITKYMVMWVINYLITIVVVSICVERIGISAYWGVCAAVVVTVFVGYFLSRYWVFKVRDVGI
jgi:putative flippase GtrA